jgi:DNA-binding NarL/FixJ family response regulator
VVLDPAVAARVVEHVTAVDRPDASAAAGQLTDRERDVLAWLASGLSNRQIGEKLSIAESTVKTHLAGLYGKLGVTDRTGAVTEAIRRGWLSLH